MPALHPEHPVPSSFRDRLRRFWVKTASTTTRSDSRLNLPGCRSFKQQSHCSTGKGHPSVPTMRFSRRPGAAGSKARPRARDRKVFRTSREKHRTSLLTVRCAVAVSLPASSGPSGALLHRSPADAADPPPEWDQCLTKAVGIATSAMPGCYSLRCPWPPRQASLRSFRCTEAGAEDASRDCRLFPIVAHLAFV